MKKIICLFFILMNLSFATDGYNFPIKDPYKATIIGSSTMMTKGVSEKVPSKTYSIKPDGFKNNHKSLWYQDSFKFSLSKQKGKAPLIFVIAGTGTTYESWKMKAFERIFHDAGYHVVLISSPFSQNFLVTAANTKMPGILFNDSYDLYNIMQEVYEKIEDKIEVTDFYLTGYSMGATEAAYISLIDEEELRFNFKKVLMINPAVNLYDSAIILDNMLDENVPGGRENVGDFIENILEEIIKHFDGKVTINESTVYQIFSDNVLSKQEMAALIGFAFRMVAIDINYTTDMINGMGVYTTEEPTKFQSMTPIFERINGASFSEYIQNIAYPFYSKVYPELSFNDLVQKADLREIKSYLINSSKIAMVSNADELILTDDDKSFLKTTFKNNGIIYPHGGHCGNMFYQTNVDNMLRFFKEGVLTNEN